MKKLTFEFEVRFRGTIELPDDADSQAVQDAIADFNIPEGEDCEYVSDTFEPDMDSLHVDGEHVCVEEVNED